MKADKNCKKCFFIINYDKQSLQKWFANLDIVQKMNGANLEYKICQSANDEMILFVNEKILYRQHCTDIHIFMDNMDDDWPVGVSELVNAV